MKKIISIILALTMCLSAVALLASCGAGESAYEIAVRNGFEGTEEEWIASLKGKDGADGKDGTDGKDGADGKDGTDGKDGANGADGADGKDGANGTDGKDGEDGKPGIAGREIELQVTDTHIQWRFVGETEWKDMVALDAITGPDGADGKNGEDGKDGADGDTPYVGADGCWWIGDVNTGVVSGQGEGTTVTTVTCTDLQFVNSDCAIWVYGGVPSLKVRYELSNGRTGEINVTESMLVNAPVFTGGGTYQNVKVKFLGFTKSTNLTITTTYELVSTVVAVGDEVKLQLKKTYADGRTEITSITKDMIVSGEIDTTKAGVYPITVEVDGLKTKVNITVVPSLSNVIEIAGALNKGESTTEKYEVTGVITNITSTTYGNMYITDGTNTFYIYGVYDGVKGEEGTKRYDKMDPKPGVGDTITLYGVLKNYNGTLQMTDGEMTGYTVHEHNYSKPTCYKPATCSVCGKTDGSALDHQFNDLDICVFCEKTYAQCYSVSNALALKDNASVIVMGTVSSIDTAYSSQYKNITVTITDDNGVSLQSYRLNGGSDLKVGDIIVITGKMSTYGGVRQIAAGATYVNKGVHTCSKFSEVSCTSPSACIVCKKVQTPALGHTDADENGFCDVCGWNLNLSDKELSFSSTANRVSQNANQQVWAQNGITLTNDKAASTSNVANYSNPARFYASSKITVEAAGMVKIVFTCNSSSYASTLKTSIGTVAGAKVTISGSVVTVEFDEAVDSFVVEKLTAQVRVNKITVTMP